MPFATVICLLENLTHEKFGKVVMAYMQIKDILENASHLRRYMLEYAQRHERKTADDQMEALYNLVSNHEQRLQETLAGFVAEAPEGLTETWIQYPGDETLEESMDQLSAVNEQMDETVLHLILTAENALLGVYEQVANQTQAPSVRELFEQLHTLEDHYLRTIANCLSELEQMNRPGTAD